MEYRPPRQPLVSPGAIDAHERDMTATVAADVPLRDLQERLARAGQWLPVDGDPALPIGRLVESNSTGPLRLGYGAWRDLLLGVQFTNGQGELITAGGRTVKNVAGYDLTKLMVGQCGMLGRLVTITVRTYQRPAGAVLACFGPDDADRTIANLLPSPLRPQWALLTPEALWCGYLGDEAALAFYQRSAGEAGAVEVTARPLGEDIAHRTDLWRADGAITFRAAVPPAKVGVFVLSARLTSWVADPVFGIVLGVLHQPEQRGTIRQFAANLGGSVAFHDRSALPGAADLDVSTTPGERQIIERLKAAFDPENHLAPLPWQNR